MTGGTSAFRRLGRSVTRIPVVGSPARAAYAKLEHRLWVHVFTPLRYRRLAAANRARDFVNARAHTARNVTRGNSRSAYQRLYSSDKLLSEYLAPERLEFYDVVAAVAAGLEPRSVVDVGCGTGHLLRALLDRREIAEAAGLDYAAAAIERARRLVPEGTFTVGDLHTFDAGRTFDVVLCTEVLEHVEDPGAARRRAGTSRLTRRACRRDGARRRSGRLGGTRELLVARRVRSVSRPARSRRRSSRRRRRPARRRPCRALARRVSPQPSFRA